MATQVRKCVLFVVTSLSLGVRPVRMSAQATSLPRPLARRRDREWDTRAGLKMGSELSKRESTDCCFQTNSTPTPRREALVEQWRAGPKLRTCIGLN